MHAPKVSFAQLSARIREGKKGGMRTFQEAAARQSAQMAACLKGAVSKTFGPPDQRR